MVKKFCVAALTGLLMMPAASMAGAGATPADLEGRIEELARQLDALKAQLAKQNETVTEYGDKVDDMDDLLSEKSEAWDLAARFKFYGDFRARGDFYSAKNVFDPGTGLQWTGDGFAKEAKGDQENDTIFTNRLRLNMRVKATENMEFKGRLAMYKVWGMQSTPTDLAGGYPIFDGNVTRTPSDSALYVDRAILNWNNIAGLPMWFSIGRRPTTDGSPAQIRMGNDTRMATSTAYMDYPFDGIALGYAWDWNSETFGSSRIRFCYGRGFEAGLQSDEGTQLDDNDFAGFSWDVFKQGNRFMNIQTFGVYNLFNYPDFQSRYVNDNAESWYNSAQKDLGQMYHTTAVYMDKVDNLNYFISAGWSHTDPNENGMFNDPIGSATANTDSEDGYSIYAGIRYDLDDYGLKLGLEYNYGSRYWVAFTPGHDDLYMSKLATRGSAYEAYLIYDLPTGEAISKYAKTFMRLGYQYYDYNYSGHNDYNYKPYDLDDEKFEMQMFGLNPVESAHQLYLTFEAYF